MSVITKKAFKVDGKDFRVNVETYNSAMEVAQDCKVRKNTSPCFHDYKTHTIKQDWHGVGSYEEALTLLRDGYQPTVEKLAASFKMSVNGTQKRMSFQNSVAGFAPVVPLALKGVPNSMISTTIKPMKCKVVDVYYDMGVSSGTSTEQIIENGQKVLAAILDLEKQGFRFNLYAVQAYSDYRSADILCVKVKSSDKPIDIKRISFPLTHHAFFRVIGFDWYGKCPVATYRDGYGQALTSNVHDYKEFGKQVFGDGSIYISCNSIKHQGIDHIKETLTGGERK